MVKLGSIFTKQKTLESPVVNDSLEHPEVNNWMISEFIIDKITPVVGVHPFPLTEVHLMVSALCWYKPEYLFEWGTHQGKSARIFSEAIEYFGLSTKIVSIDLDDESSHVEHPGKLRGEYVKNRGNVTLMIGDGVSTSLKHIKTNNVKKSMFFLDGDHSYKSVKRELNMIQKNVGEYAILIHDTFYQSKESKYNTGPNKALSEFVRLNKKYKRINTTFGLPGMDFIYK